MRRLVFDLLTACVLAATLAQAQAVTPFKLGTFMHPNAQSPRVGGPAERAGRTFVGIVLREAVVIDFAAAHKAIQTPASTVAPPADMKDLIVRYDQGLRARILDIIRSVEAAGGARPAYVFDLSAVKILPPVMPATMLNVAVNYAEHDREAAVLSQQVTTAAPVTLGMALPGTRSAPGIWERAPDDKRWNPYMFIKLPSTIIAEGPTVRLTSAGCGA
jgi:hypothetical protein